MCFEFVIKSKKKKKETDLKKSEDDVFNEISYFLFLSFYVNLVVCLTWHSYQKLLLNLFLTCTIALNSKRWQESHIQITLVYTRYNNSLLPKRCIIYKTNTREQRSWHFHHTTSDCNVRYNTWLFSIQITTHVMTNIHRRFPHLQKNFKYTLSILMLAPLWWQNICSKHG